MTPFLQTSLQSPPLPKPLPAFGHISRYWDPVRKIAVAKILPGEYYVTRSEELIVTVLGSCVSACIRDPVSRMGGMNHFMLPLDPEESAGDGRAGDGAAARYGNYAMEQLINELMKLGAGRRGLEVKVFGGGRILGGLSDVGARNIEFVREYVRVEGLSLVAHDLGGVYPRKVYYLPGNGRVWVKKLRALRNDTILRRESALLEGLRSKPLEGEVELF